MDAVLLFALPLVGGLLFCSKWNYTRWRVVREDGHRLYFRAVFFGALIFAAVAYINPKMERWFPKYAAVTGDVKTLLKPMAKESTSANAVADLAIVCFFSMLASMPLAWFFNLFFWRRVWLRRALRKDVTEAFLLDAADREMSIGVTMDDQKVYVGYIVESPDPSESRKCLRLLPLMSGYRDSDTHKINFTTFYTDLYGSTGSMNQSEPLPSPLEHLKPEDFITLLPVERITQYRFFDASAYDQFQKRGPPTPSVASAPAAAPANPSA